MDAEKVRKSGASSEYLDQRSVFAYTPARQLASVDRLGEDAGKDETYAYDAAGNVTEQTIGTATSTMTYDRNRLVTTVTGSTTSNHRYDVFGRSSTIDVGSTVVQRNSYDGWDRMIRQQHYNSDGSFKSSKSTKFDPFDRTSWQSTKVESGAPAKETRFVYLGLSDQIAIEEQPNTAGAWEQAKAYTYGPGGQKLALVDSPVDGTTSKKHFYGFNPHGDVETLTDADSGETTATYRYTAYGSTDEEGTTGADAITGDPTQDADVVNPYRFNAKRLDTTTGTYDMGFRDYDPGLNRFLTRDMYNGALADMALGADPWTTNRYAFAGGNPTSLIELDGHYPTCVSCEGTYGHTLDGDVYKVTTHYKGAREASEQRNIVDAGKLLDDELILPPSSEAYEQELAAARDDACGLIDLFCGYDSEGAWEQKHAAAYICSRHADWCGRDANVHKLEDAVPMEGGGLGKLLQEVVESGLPKAFSSLGRNAEKGVSVYLGIDRGGKAVYVGITNNLKKRAAQHLRKGRKFAVRAIEGTADLTRGQARAIEQAIIHNSKGLQNARNSISPRHAAYYNRAVEWGEAWLKLNAPGVLPK